MNQAKKMWWMAVALAVAMLAPVAGRAQETDEKKIEPVPEFQFYKLSFALRELEDGKVLNTRTYVMNMRSTTRRASESRASVRAGTRVPIMTVAYKSEGGGNTRETALQYQDVGVNIDCDLEAPDPSRPSTALRVVAEISALAVSDATQQKAPEAPLIRRVRGAATIPFILDKPILVTSVDDVTSKRQYQLEVTITKK